MVEYTESTMAQKAAILYLEHHQTKQPRWVWEAYGWDNAGPPLSQKTINAARRWLISRDKEMLSARR